MVCATHIVLGIVIALFVLLLIGIPLFMFTYRWKHQPGTDDTICSNVFGVQNATKCILTAKEQKKILPQKSDDVVVDIPQEGKWNTGTCGACDPNTGLQECEVICDQEGKCDPDAKPSSRQPCFLTADPAVVFAASGYQFMLVNLQGNIFGPFKSFLTFDKMYLVRDDRILEPANYIDHHLNYISKITDNGGMPVRIVWSVGNQDPSLYTIQSQWLDYPRYVGVDENDILTAVKEPYVWHIRPLLPCLKRALGKLDHAVEREKRVHFRLDDTYGENAIPEPPTDNIPGTMMFIRKI